MITQEIQKPTAVRESLPPKLHVLVVEDHSADAELVLHELRRGGFDVSGDVVQTLDEFRQRIKARFPDVVLANHNLGQWRGMETLEVLHQEGRDIPLILVTGALGDVNAVECIKQGATDYVLKDSLARLPESVRRALREKENREQNKRAKDELATKVQELARSNAELEQFAYVASHDLQEPLRMVAAYTQLLSERYSGKLDESADKYIHYALDGALRMQTLIQDLLAFSRVARQTAGFKDIDCNAVVDEAAENLRTAIEESATRVTHTQLPTAPADRSLLLQVFQNLIANAIKFRGREPATINVSAERRDQDWVFSVSDNGIGIAAQHAEGIFEVFKRLHTRNEYAGNGIGLAVCKKIVERHDGKIWVDSRPEGGSTFKFTLPVTHHESREKSGDNAGD